METNWLRGEGDLTLSPLANALGRPVGGRRGLANPGERADSQVIVLINCLLSMVVIGGVGMVAGHVASVQIGEREGGTKF